MRSFVGIDLGREPAPDETTCVQVPAFAGAHTILGGQLFNLINEYLEENGSRSVLARLWMRPIIDAPTSTKNKDGKRDPEMHQTKKGNEWYFGMKGHIGVDSQTKLIHSVAATAANVHEASYWGICCTAMKPGCGETRPTRASAMSLQNTRRVPKTLPTRKELAIGR